MYNHQIELIKRTITQDEDIGNNVENEDYIPVLCRLANVGHQERYSARVDGLNLAIKFIIHSFEYSGEKYLRYPEENELPYLKGKYKVTSTTLGGMQNARYLSFDEIELTCEKVG